MKATKINLFSFGTPSMRAFHMTWVAFFLCFFGWFGLAPLMPLVRADLGLTSKQVADSVIASVAGTIFARLIVGYLCDKYGPRRVYAGLLALGALPIMGIGLAHDYTSFLICRRRSPRRAASPRATPPDAARSHRRPAAQNHPTTARR